MITNAGRAIIAKKLSGITDACFDYLSLGIGARPMPPVTTGVHQSGPLTQMKHEVLRVPITSALPLDSGKIKCVAEIPAAFACEFTEVGLWTHRENAGSSRPPSQQICKFIPSESWQYNGASNIEEAQSTSGQVDFTAYNAKPYKASYSSYKDLLWTTNFERRARKEGFRLGTGGIVVKSDLSTITGASPASWSVSGNYIRMKTNGYNFDFSAAADELGIAYFLSTQTSGSTTIPSNGIKLSIQFVTSDNKYATWNILRAGQTVNGGATTALSADVTYTAGSAIIRRGDYLSGVGLNYPTEVYPDSASPSTKGKIGFVANSTTTGTFGLNTIDLSVNSNGNAYYTDYTQLQEPTTSRMSLVYDNGFQWSNVTEIRVYATTGDSNYWIGLDSLIFTNVDKMNSTYGMVAYDIAYNYETRGILTKENSPTNVLFEVNVV